MTYDFDDSTEDNLWSILYLTGYLTQPPQGRQTDHVEQRKEKHFCAFRMKIIIMHLRPDCLPERDLGFCRIRNREPEGRILL